MFGFTRHWLVPGLLALAVGASLSGIFIAPEADRVLAAEALTTAGPAAIDWADVDVAGRIARIAGTIDHIAVAETLRTSLQLIPGIADVRLDAVIAPKATPFTTSLQLDGHKVIIEGAVPSESDRERLADLGNLDVTALVIRAGAPLRHEWAEGIEVALQTFKSLDVGRATVTDKEIRIEGRAATSADYDSLLTASMGAIGSPYKITTSIAPAAVEPYTWSATFDGAVVNISGYAPDTQSVEHMRAGSAPFPASTALTLASGETSEYSEITLKMLKNLVRLDHGTAELVDDRAHVTGTAPTARIAEATIEELNQVGVDADILAPAPGGFWFSATYGPNGRSVKLDGYVPDAATRQRLQETLGFDASSLKLASGAPERFQSALDFALTALSKLREGRVGIRDSILTIAGLARSTADYQSLVASIDLGAPQGIVLARAEIDAPRVSPFTWTAQKSADGRISLVGYIPSEAMRQSFITAIDRLGTDTMRFASGQPGDFEQKAIAGLGVLARLGQGTLLYDGTTWSLSGQAADSAQRAEADAAFRAAGLADAGWAFDVDLPVSPQQTASTLPVANPYTWSATKLPNGAVTFAGYVPTDAFRQFIMTRAGSLAYDTTSAAAGAPEGFIAAALSGFDALQRLEEGRLAYSGTAGWSLEGRALDAADRDIVATILSSTIDSSAWSVEITAPSTTPQPSVETGLAETTVAEATIEPAVEATPSIAVIGPYTFSASRSDTGTYTLAGSVPTDSLLRYLGIVTAPEATTAVTVRDDAPSGFVADLLSGLRALEQLSSGELAFYGTTWSLSGQPATLTDSAAALAALNSAATPSSSWRIALADIPAPPVVEPGEPVAVEATEPAANAVEAATAEPPQAPVAVEPSPIETPQTPEPEQAPVSPYTFLASRVSGGPIVLTGDVPADPMRRYFGVIAGNVDTGGLTLVDNPPDDFLANAVAGLRALGELPDGKIELQGGVWSLTGKAGDDTTRATALAALADLPDATDWLTDIALPPPIDTCRVKVGALAAQNLILFRSGSAVLAPESETALNELAADLAACPDADVNVEGHTDADGEENANLALSVARAETVVDALIQRGVDPERLYAVGYGETLPIADNDSTEGKRLNRRIGFTLTERAL